MDGKTVYASSFATAPAPDAQADAFVKEMIADGHKNILGVGDQMSVSQDTLTILDKLAPAKGLTWTKMSDSWALEDTDLTPVSNKIAAKVREVKPDAIVLCSNVVHMNVMCKNLKSLGVTVPIYGEGTDAHPLVVTAQAGNDPKNVAGEYCMGPAVVDPSQVPDTYPIKQDMIGLLQRWQAENPKEHSASTFVGWGYDFLTMIKLAVESAATQDSAGYIAALEKVEFWGTQGEYKFSASDHVGAHGGFYQWQYTADGKFKLIRDLNSQTAVYPETAQALQSLK